MQTVSANLPLMVAAGLLVGFGSVYGNGCTSGHGVCGLSRLSVRSLVATADLHDDRHRHRLRRPSPHRSLIMSFLVNLALGLLFGIGLVISGMSDPAKVLNFLDFSGTWDPSLAFVMGGAVVVAFVGFRLVFRRDVPIIGGTFQLPTKNGIDRRILVGPAVFGIGWGLGGFCPGPALTALGLGAPGTLAFFLPCSSECGRRAPPATILPLFAPPDKASYNR